MFVWLPNFSLIRTTKCSCGVDFFSKKYYTLVSTKSLDAVKVSGIKGIVYKFPLGRRH